MERKITHLLRRITLVPLAVVLPLTLTSHAISASTLVNFDTLPQDLPASSILNTKHPKLHYIQTHLSDKAILKLIDLIETNPDHLPIPSALSFYDPSKHAIEIIADQGIIYHFDIVDKEKKTLVDFRPPPSHLIIADRPRPKSDKPAPQPKSKHENDLLPIPPFKVELFINPDELADELTRSFDFDPDEPQPLPENSNRIAVFHETLNAVNLPYAIQVDSFNTPTNHALNTGTLQNTLSQFAHANQQPVFEDFNKGIRYYHFQPYPQSIPTTRSLTLTDQPTPSPPPPPKCENQTLLAFTKFDEPSINARSQSNPANELGFHLEGDADLIGVNQNRQYQINNVTSSAPADFDHPNPLATTGFRLTFDTIDLTSYIDAHIDLEFLAVTTDNHLFSATSDDFDFIRISLLLDDGTILPLTDPTGDGVLDGIELNDLLLTADDQNNRITSLITLWTAIPDSANSATLIIEGDNNSTYENFFIDNIHLCATPHTPDPDDPEEPIIPEPASIILLSTSFALLPRRKPRPSVH